MAENNFPIPEIHFFMSGNSFCGSCKKLNYKIVPVFSDDETDEKAHFHVFTWDGDLCSELSDVAEESDFSLDTDGLAGLVQWLTEMQKKREN